MKRRYAASGTLWIGLYLVLTLAPLGLILATAPPPAEDAARPWLTEFSVALGFVGLAMMALQFVLTARFEAVKAPFGSDVIYEFHKQISLVSVVLILAHPILLFWSRDDMWERINPLMAPPPALAGLLSVGALLALAGVSVFRRRLGIEYDWWRRGHAVLAVVAIGAAVVHVVLIGHYLDTPGKKALWGAYTLLWVGLILYVRVLKPWRESGRPWEVAEVRPQPGRATTVVLRPVGHRGLRFAPGQFAWITLRASPFSDREHPFSFSGSAASGDGSVEFTIKDLGDFTSRVASLQPGERAYVDGPFGALSADRHPDAAGFVFIAGGIGITPMASHLRTFADRGERRPCVLLYACRNRDWAPLRSELEAAAARLDATIVWVEAEPGPPDASATDAPGPTRVAFERGFITPEMLRRHCPGLRPKGPEGQRNGTGREGAGFEYFICGPDPMMDAVEEALAALGVPTGDYHSERFNFV